MVQELSANFEVAAGADVKEAALYFYKALLVSSDKSSIAAVYDQQLPKVN